MSPNDRKYTKTHEWIKTEGNVALVGITDFAQKSLGDITFVELPAVGRIVKHEQECGVIESVKAASDIYSPVAGKVVEVNASLAGNPEIVNQDAYGKGWIFKLTAIDTLQFNALMDAKEYDETTGKEK
jgi:glycine cleavage system H protein